MRVLIIDDQASLLDSMRFFLEQRKCKVYTALTGKEGLKTAFRERPSLVILDLKLPDMDGQIILKKLRNDMPATQVIIVTAFQDMENTINCIKLGAFDFIHKPIDINEIDSALNRFDKINRARTHQDPPQKQGVAAPSDGKTPYIVGKSQPMKEVFKKIAMVSDSKVTVLIQGESGTGKEVIARTIHYQGAWKNHPFMVVDCSTLVDTLTESQLFGYEKGAFTGADVTRKGTLELAGEGTIFFDEIGEMPLRLQSKLLRFLHEKEFIRVGGSKVLQSDARILAATNLDLAKMASNGRLRSDLFYRLRVVTIYVPPLRDRRSDISLLANYFLKKIGHKHQMPIKTITSGARQLLESYAWPGNVRELENSLIRAAVLTKSPVLTREDILNAISETGVDAVQEPSEKTLAEVEKEHILQVLKIKQGHLGKACRTLGISRPTLRKKLNQYGYK
ncbi:MULTISPECIES: sigma-54-dependent transcriptional regulator [Desulfococcus]|jgi:two-component system response regulator AtoC|uniref:Two component, sigma54 specific, transcriptional regulator, Fis family n=1 Tax=Desulfococcus multivorans DSM 2059 TaxID=1121405 RepID=S7TM70_DESML|nr:sigma-54 dependent transcriptional regulator [Desulfococcus multivorans]AOY60703.1 two component system response regulator, sigma54-specific [Desulfococcus multivorans]AQV02784.1 sigma-54-dependent Fis family transcriptional regulator [Desulfococcus multivorans]EPR37795.1 two component, sigma54 specific, transcriptional regulator, Fis family [Desulfococcus multivorans DSM 2059]SJZ91675.1 two-component system, NtrC family, response regulator AtoC [Desulfococcus multivorans DSM 2059]